MRLLEAVIKEIKDKKLKSANGINICELMIRHNIKPPVVLVDELIKGFKENKCSNCHDMVLYPDEQCPDCGREV